MFLLEYAWIEHLSLQERTSDGIEFPNITESSTFSPLFTNRIHDLLMISFFSHNLPGYNWRQKHVKAGSPDSRELSLQADSDWLWRGGKFYNRRRQSQ